MKDGFLGWIQNALNIKPPEQVEKPVSKTGPLKPSTRTTPLAGDNFVRQTGALNQTPNAPATSPLKTPEDEAAASKKRMGFIVAYLKDPTAEKAFQDKALVYRILAEERSYQQGLVLKYTEELRSAPYPEAVPEDDPRREEILAQRQELEGKLNGAQGKQAQIFALQKKLTGVKSKTGGTGFLVPPPGM